MDDTGKIRGKDATTTTGKDKLGATIDWMILGKFVVGMPLPHVGDKTKEEVPPSSDISTA